MRHAALALALLAPALSGATEARVGGTVETRPLHDGFLYVGSAPGLNFGGNALPRALYFDLVRGGYVFPSGLEVNAALSGSNYFPQAGEYAVSMARVGIGYRPFLRDPLPMIQPYALAGAGFGGEGRYLCNAEPDCDPSRNVCRSVCSRANWVGDVYAGAGVDFTARLFDVAGQQVMAFVGVEARYEWMPSRYEMAVLTVPIGLRLQ